MLSELPLFVKDGFIQGKDTFVIYSFQCSEDDRDGPQDELSEDLQEGSLKEVLISEGKTLGDYKELVWPTKLILVMKVS